MSEVLDIGEVVRRAGVPASTLRYYESIGLIETAGRVGLRRQFHPTVLERLALISLGQDAGFSLDEIGSVFSPDGDIRIDRQRLIDKADELDAMAERLAALSDGLRHTAACPAPNHMECPSFLDMVHRAMARATAR